MNFLLFLLTLFLISVSSIVLADNSNAQSSAIGQGGNAYGGAGGTGFGGDGGMGGNSSSISQGGNGFGGQGGAGGIGGAGGLGGTAYGGIGGAGGVGTGTGGNASNAGNSQSFHMDQVRQSPAVFMGAPMPTSPCQASLGGFLSFIGGIGLAGSRTLEECELRELSRTAYGIGQPALAMHVLCKAKYAKDFKGCEEQE